MLISLMVFLKEFFEKVDFEKNRQTTKSMKNCPWGKELKNKHSKMPQEPRLYFFFMLSSAEHKIYPAHKYHI